MRAMEVRGARGAKALLAAVWLCACGGTVAAEAPLGDVEAARQAVAAEAVEQDLRVRLEAIPGLTVVSESEPAPGYRFFVLNYEQPADHARPGGERFQQRMTLLHHAEEAPLVLTSTGYQIFSFRPFLNEPASLLGGNLLLVEHRFFAESRPASNDWSLLDIEQAAADHHRIVQAFRPIYTGKWVSTGGSKGGVTSIYHRYFYPDDVDATVAYVAPNSHGEADERYLRFLANVGPEDCRAKLSAVQRALLERRAEMEPFMDALMVDGVNFDALGKDRAFEFAVLETPYYFWQYGGVQYCDIIPAPDAPAEELFFFLTLTGDPVSNFSNRGVEVFEGYFYQCSTQLGAPRYAEAHLRPLLRYPGEDVLSNFPPFGVPKKPFDTTAMLQVERWMRKDAERMLLIYGQNDPWSTGAFQVDAANDSFRFFVADGNHGSQIRQLPEAEATLALQKLAEWTGVTPQLPGATTRRAVGDVDTAIPLVNPVLEWRHPR